MRRALLAAGLSVLATGTVRAQLDFGESLESNKCSFRNFQQRVDEVETACCSSGQCANGAAPTQCNIRCALVRPLSLPPALSPAPCALC